MGYSLSLLDLLDVFMANTAISGLPLLTGHLTDVLVKGMVFLAAVAILTGLLRRASAAQRFTICQTGLIVLLLIPVFSLLIPRWQVLPNWFSTSPKAVARDQFNAVERSHELNSADVGDSDFSKTTATLLSSDESKNEISTSESTRPSNIVNGEVAEQIPVPESVFSLSQLPKFLFVAWSIGAGLLLFRLIAGAFLLRLVERNGPTWTLVPGCKSQGGENDAAEIPEAILKSWKSVTQLSGTNRPVTLLLRSGSVIPSVWGVFRARLLLPDDSRNWSQQRLQCVLAHELAHINRRDALGQWIAQMACALHWMNPLVWLVARSMQMLREQATDDAVLATGIQSSTYARQLVEIVDSQNWKRPLLSTELAMAERSGLKGRIEAILSGNRNRSGVSPGFVVTMLLLCSLVAIPVSVAGVVGPRSMSLRTDSNLALPRSPELMSTLTDDSGAVTELFELWLQQRRYPDEILPGGLVGHLAGHFDSFLESSELNEQTITAAGQLRAVMDSDRDWTTVEARALLQQMSSISDSPIAIATLELQDLMESCLVPGQDWHPDLEKLKWGPPAANGLRAAWQIDNERTEYVTGSTLEGTAYVHNSGIETVTIVVEKYLMHRETETTARDKDGNPVSVQAVWQTGWPRLRTFVLQPNQYGYATIQPIAIDKAPANQAHLGVIDAKPGEMTFVSMNVPTDFGDNKLVSNSPEANDERRRLIEKRVMLASPLPKSIKHRQSLVANLTFVILGRPPTNDEVESFSRDDSPDALKNLADRLATQPGLELFRGKIPTGELSLNVVKSDPAAELIELRELLSEMKTADSERRQQLLASYKAGDQAAMAKVMNRPHPPEAARLMLLAERHPDTEDAFEASMLILKTTYQSERDIAGEILFNHHVESSRLDEVMDHLGYTFRAVEWAKKTLQSNQSRNVIAHARFCLAGSTERDGELDQTQVVADYRDLVMNYGDVPFRHGYWGIPQEELPPDSPYRKPATIGAMALQALERLGAYQQIKRGAKLQTFSGIDLDNQPISLDEYRGKAVLIVYWTSWCGPCLVNAEMEQRLLKRYAGQPFDILGICGDEEITPRVKLAASLHGMTWRSIQNNLPDGTKLSEQFGFPSLPYVMLIDGDGIIRETEFVVGVTHDSKSQELHFQSAIEELLPDFKK